MSTTTLPFPLPSLDRSRVIVEPPEGGAGNWAGAPSACLVDGVVHLAYRMRAPVGKGRGYAVVVARAIDGERLETLCVIESRQLDAESLERPALLRTPDGRWRLYLSCATTGTKHWRIELLEADDPRDFDPRTAKVVLPGDENVGVKDPVIVHEDGRWHLWASCHPLADPDEADQMVTEYATSDDGVDWTWQGTALDRTPGRWDSRGVRVSAVIAAGGRTVACYDGRASAAENCEERTGIAIGATRPAHAAERRTRGRVAVRRAAVPLRGPAADRVARVLRGDPPGRCARPADGATRSTRRRLA